MSWAKEKQLGSLLKSQWRRDMLSQGWYCRKMEYVRGALPHAPPKGGTLWNPFEFRSLFAWTPFVWAVALDLFGDVGRDDDGDRLGVEG
ncbi:MAG: hypothetical protein RBU37_18035, partial [Myxococcota bacterium]|nr:hypothetical protein [Myxococcota bacterium]